MPRLTLSMIVKNEEQHLRECLKTVEGIVDEIVIVDTGSTDSTVEIAKEFGAKIFYFEWIKDFSAARNFGLSKSTGDWILILDADDRLEENSKKEILEKIKDNNNYGVRCIINSLDFEEAPTINKYTRLFRNDKNVSYSGKAHEQIEQSLVENGYKIIDSSIEIVHHGYNVPRAELQKKAERNLELLLKDYEERPTVYGAYQLANSYKLLDNREKTNFYAKKALFGNHLLKELRSVCYLHIIDNEIVSGNLLAAKEVLDKATYENKDHVQLNLVASQIYQQLNENDKAINHCIKAYQNNLKIKKSKKNRNILDILVDDKKIIYQGIFLSLTSSSLENLEYFLSQLSAISESEHRLFYNILQNNKLIDKDIDSLIKVITTNGLDLVLKLLENSSNIEFKLEFYSKIYEKFNTSSKYLVSFGAFLISINQLNEAEVILKLSVDNTENNFSGLFYLASVYVQNKKYLELTELLSEADEKIDSHSIYYPKLQILKEKISPLINLAIT